MASSLFSSSWITPLLFILPFCKAATVTYDWNITWTTTNPDSAYERTTIGINNQWPLPLVNVTMGDRIIANVNNQLGNQSTSIHWHGLFQNGTNEMDGVVGVTQCGIAPGSTFTYNFTVDQPGTYWYHSHQRGQYPDGLRGPMIINDPTSPYKGQYDEEVVWTLSDWYHEQMPGLIKKFINPENPTGAEPIPDNALMNEGQNVSLSIQPGKTYLVHLINMGAFASQYFWIEGHQMSIVEVDGIWTEPYQTDMIYTTVAQRHSFLLTTRNDTSNNFAITGSMDTDLFDKIPDSLNWNVTGWLVYDDQKPLPDPTMLDEFNPFDDFNLVPFDRQTLLPDPDQTVTMTMYMDNLGDGANYAFINDNTYVTQKVPSLYSALGAGPLATNETVYGVNSNPFVLEYQQTVDLVLNNQDTGKHPFHLHGHAFQVIARADDDSGNYNGNDTFPQIPMRRDVVYAKPNSHFVIRFKSDNPGIWLFHCHLEWHIDSGLIATIIEAPLELQKTQTIPENHLQACREANLPTTGNAAANTEDYLDVTGANYPPAALPSGFTARGIVALVFSCISAFLGMGVITWYGMAPLTSVDVNKAKKTIKRAGRYNQPV